MSSIEGSIAINRVELVTVCNRMQHFDFFISTKFTISQKIFLDKPKLVILLSLSLCFTYSLKISPNLAEYFLRY
jgi:hypothetical protein